MGNDKIGLDGGKATTALQTTEGAAANIVQALGAGMQAAVLGPLMGVWYGDDAIRLLGKLKETLEGAGGEFEKIFQSINDTVTQNAQAFEQQHGAQVFNPVSHTPIQITADVAGALKDKGGFVGIEDSKVFETAINDMKRRFQEVDGYTKDAKRGLADSGFYGAGQQEALDQSTTKIVTNLNDMGTEIVEATKKVLEETKQREEELAKQSANKFGGQ